MDTYEKKYKEIVGLIKKAYLYAQTDSTKAVLEEIFPELKESEDEKIKKAIISYIDYVGHRGGEWFGVKVDDIIAWLEKQGEQKSVNDLTPQEAMDIAVAKCFEQGEQKPADKVEPKFKVGDWITNGQLTCKVLSVTGKSYELHLYNDDYCHFGTDIQSVDKDYHLWSIKDSKDGDVLTSIGFHSNCTFIFKGLDNWKFNEPNGDRAVATGYCCLYASSDKMEFGMQGPDCVEVNTIKPATKIQRDLLFQKMKEAGYEWDAEKKELKKIEQKPTWSEEDEKIKRTIISDGIRGVELDTQQISWLKSLKERIGG